MEAKEDQKM